MWLCFVRRGDFRHKIVFDIEWDYFLTTTQRVSIDDNKQQNRIDIEEKMWIKPDYIVMNVRYVVFLHHWFDCNRDRVLSRSEMMRKCIWICWQEKESNQRTVLYLSASQRYCPPSLSILFELSSNVINDYIR